MSPSNDNGYCYGVFTGVLGMELPDLTPVWPVERDLLSEITPTASPSERLLYAGPCAVLGSSPANPPTGLPCRACYDPLLT